MTGISVFMRTLYQVDEFTTVPFTGNAGESCSTRTASDTEMLAVVRELNNSETVFVLPQDGPDHDVRVRFFGGLTGPYG
ncbi:PhzF family phenazine biosynthesis protein [Streptomyces lasalocidi]